jgi:peptide/nickel transport system ATP-binding protein
MNQGKEEKAAERPEPAGDPAPLLRIRGLRTHFFLDEGLVRAVDGIDLDVARGQVLGIVGESGCGKSVTALSILRALDQRARIVEGSIFLTRNGRSVDIAALDPKGQEIREIRGKEISIVFQEPMTSFIDVYTIGQQIMEAILVHEDVTQDEARHRTLELLNRVGIPNPKQRIDNYPFQLSGGMRQRAMIAMALSCGPKLLIADEPTTALDVTIEAQIIHLIQQLQNEIGMSILLITHNMGVVAKMADVVAVMYLGKVVELASVEELFDSPKHPYTQALLRSIPRVGKRVRAPLETIAGMIPDPYHLPSGCTFHPRCPHAMKGICDHHTPTLAGIAPGRSVSCFLYKEPESE